MRTRALHTRARGAAVRAELSLCCATSRVDRPCARVARSQVIFVYALPTNGTATDSAGGAAPGGGSAAPASADSEQAAEPAAHSRGGRHSRHGSSHARGAESAAPDESEEEEEVDLSSLGRCPLVGDPDMKAAEAMGVLCAVGEDTDCSVRGCARARACARPRAARLSRPSVRG